MPDPIFADARLARLYDIFEGERPDLDQYVAMVGQFGARTVLDVGCGTGTLCSLLAQAGFDVIGVDPAAASLALARTKPGADSVRWVLGDATTLPPLQVDLAVMTGNVAQVFVDDTDWAATLAGVRAALRPGGRLVFETRDPARRAWRGWNPAETHTARDIAGLGTVAAWCEVTEVRGPLVTFRWTYEFRHVGEVLTSDSTLRFRSLDEVAASLASAGFAIDEIRDAPDRPGLEFVFVASRRDASLRR